MQSFVQQGLSSYLCPVLSREYRNVASDTYKTIESPSQGLFKDKGSRFIAYAFPVKSDAEARIHVEALRKEHHSARHHCWAYRLGRNGDICKSNDDGEPSNSAGKPILGQLVSRGLTCVVVVVVRYFGGTLLGVGGLMQAYKESTADALDNARVVEAIIETQMITTFPYQSTNEVMKVLKEGNARILDQKFDNMCELAFSVREQNEASTLSKLSKVEGINIQTQ